MAQEPPGAVDGVRVTDRLTLAAALIVRDEEAVLGACLGSLDGLVDEIRVHDTGSSDATVAVAAAYGARISQGPWVDDFAAARNDGLAGCVAGWVLAIDADEQAVADAPMLREVLATTTADVLLVEVDNSHERAGYAHRVGRVFRLAAAEWSGQVHEQLVARGERSLRVASLPREVLHLRHTGYATDEIRHAKCVRNAALAQAAIDRMVADGGTADRAVVARTMLDLGRSWAGAGCRQEAVNAFEMLRELFPGTPEWMHATDFLARQVLAAGMDEVCLHLTGQLRAAGAPGMYCDWLAGQALAQLGDVDGAKRLLAGVTEVVDTAGRRFEAAELHELKRLVDALH